jgi:hypothetical protein
MPISDDMPWSPSPDGNASPSSIYQAIVFDVLMRCNVCKPATVQSWSPPVAGMLPAVVTVQIDFKYARAIDNASDLKTGEVLANETAGLRAIGTWVPIPNVPVLAMGSPSFGWRGAIPVGTTGLLVFADAILDQWKSSGGPVDPAMYERHSLNCGIFIPTLYHGGNTPTIDPLVDVLGPNDGTAGFEIATGTDKSLRVFTDGPNATIEAATLVNLGAAATLGVARLTDTVAADTTMAIWIGVAQGLLTALAGMLAVPAPIAPSDFGLISSASTKVKSE